jgi:hypothetical protein
MKKIALISLILVFCISNFSIAQNKVQGRLMIIGGITDYDLTDGFESFCSKLTVQKAGANLVKDVISAVHVNLLSKSLSNVALSKNDSSFNISPLPFNKVIIHSMYSTGPMSAGPPDEFYMFNKNGDRLCEFQKFYYNKPPKMLQNQSSDLSLFASDCEYILVIWPGWWFHQSYKTSHTHIMVVYALYGTKTGELLFSDSYWTEDKGITIEYESLINKVGENVTKSILKYMKD